MEDRRYDDTVENPKTEAVFVGPFGMLHSGGRPGLISGMER